MFEAAAVLAGTILMASGTTGNGPDCHNSDVTLSNLLPLIAAYRDQYYEGLLAHTTGPHGDRRHERPCGAARGPSAGTGIAEQTQASRAQRKPTLPEELSRCR